MTRTPPATPLPEPTTSAPAPARPAQDKPPGGKLPGGKPPAGKPGPGPAIGESCGPDDACAAGLACVKYYGFAGTRGPEFKSCEVRCETDSACPKGLSCVTISDGPGRVCR